MNVSRLFSVRDTKGLFCVRLNGAGFVASGRRSYHNVSADIASRCTTERLTELFASSWSATQLCVISSSYRHLYPARRLISTSSLTSSIPWAWCSVWAREHCRISPLRFLAECRRRRLNQGSFVLLSFVLFAFFWVVLSFSNVYFWFVF